MPNTPLPIRPQSPEASRHSPTSDEREAVAAYLSERFADDTLSLEDFERRVEIVYRAVNMRELDALTADLPRATQPVASVPHVARAIADSVPLRGRRFAILSNLEHHSITVVPRHLDVSAIFGNVELDLRDAAFGAGASELHVRAVFGHVAITVPATAMVEHHGSAILGSFECPPPPRAARPGAGPIIRVTGHAVFGAVEIRFADAAPSALRGAIRVDRPGQRS